MGVPAVSSAVAGTSSVQGEGYRPGKSLSTSSSETGLRRDQQGSHIAFSSNPPSPPSPSPPPPSPPPRPPIGTCPSYFHFVHDDLELWRAKGGITWEAVRDTRKVAEHIHHEIKSPSFFAVILAGKLFYEDLNVCASSHTLMRCTVCPTMDVPHYVLHVRMCIMYTYMYCIYLYSCVVVMGRHCTCLITYAHALFCPANSYTGLFALKLLSLGRGRRTA